MRNWISSINQLFERNEDFVLVTLLAVRGSTPRDTDSKMVVTEHELFDSIGGGNLEFQITEKSRALLGGSHAVKIVEEYSLGASLGQCCGGQATVLFEYFPATLFNVVLFGGGHVASALVKILRELPCKFDWIDSREEFVARNTSDGGLQFHDTPEKIVEGAAPQSSYLIMTHDHSLDFILCEKILGRQVKRGDVKFCGLIGSKSKSGKFHKRLAYKGFESAIVKQLKCPVGMADVPGKRPMEVAVSIAAELIQMHASGNSARSMVEFGATRDSLLKLIQNR